MVLHGFEMCIRDSPNIWEYEDEADEIKDDLRTSFESLRKFYAKMAEQELSLIHI